MLMNLSASRLASIVAASVLVTIGGVAAPNIAAAADHSAHGTTYYVSPSGADTHKGSVSAPFAHIQKCAAVMVAGDTCQIASGTYRETVTPAHQGTANAPITYTAAPGATVTIDGTDPVTGWAPVTGADLTHLESADAFLAGSPFAAGVGAGHVYQADVTLDPALAGNQVFVDGAADVEAQWPYPGNNLLTPTMASAQSGTDTSVSDTALTQPDGYWVGARLTARNWFVSETDPVTSSSVGTVTAGALPDCVSLNPNAHTSYSLSGKLEVLGHAGEWYYQPASHTLYVWTLDGDSPAGHVVEAKQRAVGFDLSNRSYTSLVGLDVRATTVQTSASSTHDVISGMTARYLSAYDDLTPDPRMVTVPDGCAVLTAGESTSGILLNGTDNTFRDSTIDWSAGNGVMVGGSGNTVTDNTITDVDYMGSYAAGINVIGPDEKISHNTVASMGRSDINIDNKMTGLKVPGEAISYNDLSGYNNLVNDGGALYVCCAVDLAGSEFDHNLMHDPAPLAAAAPAPGIYLDNGVYDATVYDNVAWDDTTYGVVLFNGDTSTGNKVFNNTSGTDSKAVSLFGSTYTDMEVSNNIGDVDTNPGVRETDNLPYSTDPLFAAPQTHDYSLQAQSPARSAGVVRPPATNGYRDQHPDEGAYQYGVPKWTGGATLQQTTVQAERYAGNSGVSRHAAGTGEALGGFDGGDWVQYTGVDFGTGRDLFTGSIGEDPTYAGRQIQIRVDSLTGPVIGTLTVAATGGFDDYVDQSVPIVHTKGVHDVYLVALGSAPGVGNVDYFSVTSPRT
jgi:hypothetical protein